MSVPTPLEQLLQLAVDKRNVTIGLPAPAGRADRRFPLTPEAAGMLVERGFSVRMQPSGAAAIHYTDARYVQYGVEITDRARVLHSDVVIYMAPVTLADARAIKRGAMLLTVFDSALADASALGMLMGKGVVTIALDRIKDEGGNHPFADILAEIAGRAAIALASSLLADADHGKGILLGGIAGIVPCEVTIMGSGIDAIAAARSAIGLGAIVRMFDNDVYRLRSAIHELGPGVAGSALHPHVLLNALRAADVVVATDVRPMHIITADVVAEMKRGVIIFDLNSSHGQVFPGLRQVEPGGGSVRDISMDGHRVCYVNPGDAVPRTVAMALSNTFLTMLGDIFTCDGLTNALMLNRGLQGAALTFMGRAVNPHVARLLDQRYTDINLLLQFS